eukprot:345735-Prorocentrum_minimum.AAC.1
MGCYVCVTRPSAVGYRRVTFVSLRLRLSCATVFGLRDSGAVAACGVAFVQVLPYGARRQVEDERREPVLALILAAEVEGCAPLEDVDPILLLFFAAEVEGVRHVLSGVGQKREHLQTWHQVEHAQVERIPARRNRPGEFTAAEGGLRTTGGEFTAAG